MPKKVAAVICARAGSKRIKNKNMIMCGGKPLLEWSLITATKAKCVDKIFLSADSKEMNDLGLSYGAELIERPWQLYSDGCPNCAYGYWVTKEALKREPFGFRIFMAPTSPTIRHEDVDAAFEKLLNVEAAIEISPYIKVTKTSHLMNHFVLLPTGAVVKLFPDTVQGFNPYVTHNICDVYYTMGGFQIQRIKEYMYSVDYKIREDTKKRTVHDELARLNAEMDFNHLQHGYTVRLAHIISLDRGADVDTYGDLDWAEYILNKRNREGYKHDST